MNALLYGIFNLEGFSGPPEIVQPNDRVTVVRSLSELDLVAAHMEGGVSPTCRGFCVQDPATGTESTSQRRAEQLTHPKPFRKRHPSTLATLNSSDLQVCMVIGEMSNGQDFGWRIGASRA
jgi:hypothetical protein